MKYFPADEINLLFVLDFIPMPIFFAINIENAIDRFMLISVNVIDDLIFFRLFV